MDEIGQFARVSQKTFLEYLPDSDVNEITLPTRSTKDSAGYDIYSPVDLTIPGHTVAIIPTGIKAYIKTGWFLQIAPRSSIGIKRHLMLANTVGIIDADFVDNEDNEGMIFCAFYNYYGSSVELKKGERIAQAIFQPYGVTYDDDVTARRTGGIGSTGT